ncbi:MAG: hypothetical protein QXW93_00635 [Desulfurococcaceae archaeon]
MINCSDLLEVTYLKNRRGLKLLDIITTALMLLEKHGRVSIAKKLGCTERQARNIIEFLKKEKEYFTILQRVLSRIERKVIYAIEVDCNPVAYYNLANDLILAIMQNIVALRDYIIIHSGDPEKIEIIGIVKNGELEIPGIPPDLAAKYAGLSRFLEDLNGVVVCWRKYNENLDDAVFILSLIDLCSSSRV